MIKQLIQRATGLIFIFVILCSLIGCTINKAIPSKDVILQALETELQISEEKLLPFKTLEELSPVVSELRVKTVVPLSSAAEGIFEVSGSIGIKLRDKDPFIEVPFKTFLLIGDKEQSWRLAKRINNPKSSSEDWETYPLDFDP